MKSTIYYSILGMTLIALLSQCKSQSDIAQNGRLNVIEYDNPILHGEFNEVAELVLHLNKPQFIRELSFDLTGQDTLESLRVFQVMKNEGDMEKLPIAAIKDVVGSNIVYLDRQLEAGEHRFLVSVFPKSNQDSANIVRINFNHMATEKSRYMVTRDPL
ncbi:MAG TPA: hypothetical protein VK921_01275 [Anditalea sp.]|nr:hypothetical protein [Anditalea sp.]